MNSLMQFILGLVEKAFGLFSSYLLGKKTSENETLKTRIENDKKVIEAHKRLGNTSFIAELRKRYKR